MDDNDHHQRDDEINSRRQNELEALQAFYDHQLCSSLQPRSSGETSNNNANDDNDHDDSISLNGPWFIELIDNSNNIISDDTNSRGNNCKIPTLEIRLPQNYPLTNTSPPTPILHHVDTNNHKLLNLTSAQKQSLIDELMEMYEADMDMAILWAERCRMEFLDVDLIAIMSAADDAGAVQNDDDAIIAPDNYCDDANNVVQTETNSTIIQQHQQSSLSIRFLTFNHLLYGKSHKNESQIVSLASKFGLSGFVVYGTPGIIGLLVYNSDEEDIVDFAKECSNRIGKRATVLDFEMKIGHEGGLLPEYNTNAESNNNGGSELSTSKKKPKKSKGSNSGTNNNNSTNKANTVGDPTTTPLLANLLGADKVTTTNNTVSIDNSKKSGLRHFDSIAELKEVLPGGLIQSILGL